VTATLDILHVDMDAFFAAVEVLDDPKLLGLPVIVGGTGSRGVVASCSYEARATGVRSAMSMVEARHRCPQATVLPGRHGRYGEVSRLLHQVFEVFTPLIEPIALDEAFLDVSGGHRLFGSSLEIAEAIRTRVMADLKLSCSVGIARCKLLAKLASRAAKPIASASGTVAGPGVVVVLPEHELEFLHPRPVSTFGAWGPGRPSASPATGSPLLEISPRSTRRTSPGSSAARQERSSTSWRGPGTTDQSSRADRSSPWATRRRSRSMCTIPSNSVSRSSAWPTP